MSGNRELPSNAVHLARSGHTTYHLTPVGVWETQQRADFYAPEAFGREGFIHCTDSLEELIAVGNRYYRDDPASYVVLQIDCDRVSAPIFYEDAQRQFPHIYGPLETSAVVAVLPVRRETGGAFTEMA